MDRIPFDPYDVFGYLAAGFLVLVGLQLTIGFPPVFGRDFKLVESVALLLAAYVAGQLVATPAKAILEDLLVGRILGRPSVNLLQETPPRLGWLLFPGFYVPLPPDARRCVLEKAKAEGVTQPGEDLFLLARYCPLTLGDSRLMGRLGAFLNQYGFSRNLSFAALVVGIAMLLVPAVLPGHEPQLWKYGITILVAGVLLLYRYLKFYRQYSYELFNTYARAKS
jgi:hypothetical protein